MRRHRDARRAWRRAGRRAHPSASRAALVHARDGGMHFYYGNQLMMMHLVLRNSCTAWVLSYKPVRHGNGPAGLQIYRVLRSFVHS